MRGRVAQFIPLLFVGIASSDDSCSLPRFDIEDLPSIQAALDTHGYAVLTNVTRGAVDVDWKQLARSLPDRVFPGRLLSSGANTLSGVHEENAKMSEKTKRLREECLAKGECSDDGSWTSNFSIGGMPLLPHTDGYVYGDHLPDIIFLLSETQAEQGGSNFIVDGEDILRRLKNDAESPRSYDVAHSATIDLTERISAGGITTGREAFGTVFRRHSDGGIWWRRQLKTSAYEQSMEQRSPGAPSTIKAELLPYQSLWAPAGPEEEHDEALEMLHKVDAAIQLETQVVPRFMLNSGEALVVNNYRVLHGRDGYTAEGFESDRKIWRIWCWTNRSLGLPEGVEELGSPLDAEKMR